MPIHSDVKVRIQQRAGISLLVSCTKMFPCGFFWQLMGFAVSGGPSRLLEFSLATGAGDAFGVFIGNLFLSLLLRYRELSASKHPISDKWGKGGFGCAFFTPVLKECAVLAAGAFCSGSIWQPMLQAVSATVKSFTLGALCVGLACGTAFFAGITIAEYIMQGKASSKIEVIRNVTLSIVVWGGAAFFVGTDVAYKGNWLAPIVGERGGETKGYESVKAGWSTALGYLVFQLLLMLLVPMGLLWTETPHSWESEQHTQGRSGQYETDEDGMLANYVSAEPGTTDKHTTTYVLMEDVGPDPSVRDSGIGIGSASVSVAESIYE
eukprot:m.762100 g.762100  ORF g.762100 m.762100 type:complete len:322 (+) comp23208_c1_seq24:294-1259(+)